MNWNKTIDKLPIEGLCVNTKIEDEKGIRNECKIIFEKIMWWLIDRSMYVYYTPTHWSY